MSNMKINWLKLSWCDKKHMFRHHTRLGQAIAKFMSYIGVKLLKLARKCFKHGSRHCTWCGETPGMVSCVSSKGLRCMGMGKNCQDMPDK